MDEHATQHETGFGSGQPSLPALAAERSRMRAFSTAQRQRLNDLERQITDQLDRVRDELSREKGSVRARLEEINGQSEHVHERAAELEAQALALDRRQAEFEAQCQARDDEFATASERLADLRQALDQRQHEVEEARAHLQQEQRALAALEQELQADRQETARLRKRCEEKLALLEQEQADLQADQARTQTQRRRIAEDFRRQREAHLQEISDRRAQLEKLAAGEQADLEELLAEARRESEQLGERLRQRGDELSAETAAAEAARLELARTQARLDLLLQEQNATENREVEACQRQTAVEEQLAAAQAECQELRRCLEDQAQRAASSLAADTKAEALTAQRDELAQKLAAAEQALAAAQAAPPAGGTERRQELAELKRRYELAMEDVRDLKKRNAELEKKAVASPAPTHGAVGGALDWEAQKRRLLASLEADGDAGDDDEQAERLRIEEVIRTTDAIVRDKEAEINELKQLLEQQSGNLGSVAVGAAALGEFFDKDEIITQERERLKQLETQWEEKLRSAEIELSVQRAQVARARSELDERQRAFEEQLADQAAHPPAAEGGKATSKPQRGRWLARLGLTEDDKQKPGR